VVLQAQQHVTGHWTSLSGLGRFWMQTR
jgi:hypothetical protein